MRNHTFVRRSLYRLSSTYSSRPIELQQQLATGSQLLLASQQLLQQDQEQRQSRCPAVQFGWNQSSDTSIDLPRDTLVLASSSSCQRAATKTNGAKPNAATNRVKIDAIQSDVTTSRLIQLLYDYQQQRVLYYSTIPRQQLATLLLLPLLLLLLQRVVVLASSSSSSQQQQVSNDVLSPIVSNVLLSTVDHVKINSSRKVTMCSRIDISVALKSKKMRGTSERSDSSRICSSGRNGYCTVQWLCGEADTQISDIRPRHCHECIGDSCIREFKDCPTFHDQQKPDNLNLGDKRTETTTTTTYMWYSILVVLMLWLVSTQPTWTFVG